MFLSLTINIWNWQITYVGGDYPTVKRENPSIGSSLGESTTEILRMHGPTPNALTRKKALRSSWWAEFALWIKFVHVQFSKQRWYLVLITRSWQIWCLISTITWSWPNIKSTRTKEACPPQVSGAWFHDRNGINHLCLENIDTFG